MNELTDATVVEADGRLLIVFDDVDDAIDVASIETLARRFDGDLSSRLEREL